jgi:hypothetical protein
MYLSQNPLEMETVRQMSPMQAAVYIDTQVKAKAVSSRPTPNPISEPTEVLKGAGQPEGDRGPKGAVYE